MVVKEFGSYKILSSPLRGDHENPKRTKNPNGSKENLLYSLDEIIVVGRKESYAVQADGTQNILIDDRGKNIQGWRSKWRLWYLNIKQMKILIKSRTMV